MLRRRLPVEEAERRGVLATKHQPMPDGVGVPPCSLEVADPHLPPRVLAHGRDEHEDDPERAQLMSRGTSAGSEPSPAHVLGYTGSLGSNVDHPA